MKILRSTLAATTLSLALCAATASFAAETEAGVIDIGQLMPSAKGQFIEVNLSPVMLKFAARIAAVQDHETADLLRNLKSIRVNVVGLDDSNRAGMIEKIEAVRAKLKAQGWTKMVTVREKEGGDNVDIHVKQRADEGIDGLVVTAIDRQGEAVFVNIVGNITADQLGEVADRFDLAPLKRLHVELAPRAAGKNT